MSTFVDSHWLFSYTHTMKRLFFALLIILVLGLGIWILRKPESSLAGKAKGYNLLVITLDTVRADRIGAYGCTAGSTPRIDQLVERGVLFEQCYSPVPLTLPAHCSIFTGKYPLGHRVRDNGIFNLPDEEKTLAEMMKQDGYHTYAVISSFVLLSKFGLGQGFDLYDDSLRENRMIHGLDSEIGAQEVYDKFSRWFSKREAGPFFAWVHFYDPHAPYSPPAEYRTQFGSTQQGLYDGEIAHVDHYVGKIIDDLKGASLFDRTVVVIVGDHGEAFGEHEEYGHSIFCYQENLRVPMIMVNETLFPSGTSVSYPVVLVDLLPTLADMFQLEPAAGIQGMVLNTTGKERQDPIYIESLHGKEERGWAPLVGLIRYPHKYISLPEPELYHLEQDPKEGDNLYWKQNQLAKELDSTLKNLMLNLASGSNPTDARRTITDSDRSHLRSLGYISSTGSQESRGLDPKKGIKIKNHYTEIEKQVRKGDYTAARQSLIKAAEEYGKIPEYFDLLDQVLVQEKDTAGIVQNWIDAVAAFPNNPALKINLATAYFNQQRMPQAQQEVEKILQEHPDCTRAYILLGKIYEKESDPQGALNNFVKAISLEPQNQALKVKTAKIQSQIGIMHFQKGEAGKAREAYLKALQWDSQNPRTHNNLGILYLSLFLRQRQPDLLKDSLKWFNQALKLDPNLPSALNSRGSAYKFSNNPKAAIEDWKKALEVKPDYIDVHFNLAVTYLQMGMKDQAKTQLNRLHVKYSDNLSERDRGRLTRLLNQIENPKGG